MVDLKYIILMIEIKKYNINWEKYLNDERSYKKLRSPLKAES